MANGRSAGTRDRENRDDLGREFSSTGRFYWTMECARFTSEGFFLRGDFFGPGDERGVISMVKRFRRGDKDTSMVLPKSLNEL